MDARTAYVKASDGAHLAYSVTGAGEFDLLYATGFMFSIDSWDAEPHVAHTFRRLASFSRLIRFDARGMGLSDPIDPAHPPTLERRADDIADVLHAAGSTSAVLIGDGGVGAAAIELAVRRPDLVRALVLVNSAASYIRREDYPIGFDAKFIEGFLRDNMDPDEDWSFGESDDLALNVPSLRDDAGFRAWWTRAAQRSASPAVARALVGASARADVRHLLVEIRMPALVVHSGGNLFVPVDHGRYLGEHIPGALYVELPGTDSAMWGGDADLYVDEIEEFLTGRRGGAVDRVVATVLFTDIVDSTGRAVALGDQAWRALLDAHDAVVRAELARYGGREVNTTGDGFVGAFDSPTQAVRAGAAIVTAAARDNIAVRVGLHTGEAERRGDDLAGLTVHIAARVAGLAATGEVLVSRTVRDLVAGSGLRFADRGEHELKGVPDTWQLFALAT